MSLIFHRRHHRWHEQLLLSRFFMILIGWALTVILPYLSFWPWNNLLNPNAGQRTALIVTSLSYLVTYFGILKLQARYPGGRAAGFIAPKIILVYGAFALITLMFRMEVSRYLLFSSSVCALVWMYTQYILTYKYMRLKLAVIPGGQYTEEILALDFIRADILVDFDIGKTRYDGVVADFDYINMHAQRFLTQCALSRTAVYNAKDIYESLTGRVKIHRMSENNIGSLLPSTTHEIIKRCMDLMIVILSAPVVLVISAITALCIKIESRGPVIYSQIRIGQGNKFFTIYKFRSMRFDRRASEQFAGENDPRVTQVGKIIRKLRIDELPQFINVLRGEMSLIGPRPEQPSFVEEYEGKIPFYSYRHIVKPGITGWAQVRHGYTAGSDETQVKIEHDFYYIKNCSFSLDFIIIILTIRIMATGFGAR